MNRLALLRVDLGDDVGPGLEICVDGRPLLDDVVQVERSIAPRRDRGVVDGYAPLPLRHLRGAGAAAYLAPDSGRPVVPAACECGEVGCWPLLAHVVAEGEEVRWERFRTGHRDWDYGDFGYRFARGEYAAALAVFDGR